MVELDCQRQMRDLRQGRRAAARYTTGGRGAGGRKAVEAKRVGGESGDAEAPGEKRAGPHSKASGLKVEDGAVGIGHGNRFDLEVEGNRARKTGDGDGLTRPAQRLTQPGGEKIPAGLRLQRTPPAGSEADEEKQQHAERAEQAADEPGH